MIRRIPISSLENVFIFNTYQQKKNIKGQSILPASAQTLDPHPPFRLPRKNGKSFL
jgi:hypothetical protein